METSLINRKKFSKTNSKLIRSRSLFEERFIMEQLRKTEEIEKGKESLSLLYDPQIFKVICSDSILLLNLDFTINKTTGFFSYFIKDENNRAKPDNFLKIIKEDYWAEFLVLCKKSKIDKKHFLFETKIQTTSSLCFRVIFKVNFLTKSNLYNLSINNIQLCEGNRNRTLFGQQAEIISKQLCLHLLLFNNNYEILDYSGNESIFNNNTRETLFSSIEKVIVRKLFPFINKTLKGIETEGKIRINQSVFDIQSSSIRDENGFTNNALLLLKISSC